MNSKTLFRLFSGLLICSSCTLNHAEEIQDASISSETEASSAQSQYQQELQEKIKRAREAARQQTEQLLKEQQAAQEQQIKDLTQPKAPTSNNEYVRIVQPPSQPSPIVTTPAVTKSSGGFPFFFIIAFGILGFIGWKLLGKNTHPKTRKYSHRTFQGQSSSQDMTNTHQQRSQNSSSQQHNGQQSYNDQSTQQQTPLQTSERVKTVLDDFFSAEPQIPMAYRQQLNDIQLDFSAESLHRLDQVLLSIKQQKQPDYAQYCEELPYQQFVIFCGIYLGTTIARVTHQSIKWFSYEEMKAFIQRTEFPQTLGTFISCMIGNGFHHLPIEIICDGLFTDQPQETCQERLDYYQQQANPLILITEQSKNLSVEAQNDMEQAFVSAMQIAGFLAHNSLYMIEGGSSLISTIIQATKEKILLQRLMYDDPAKEGHKLLKTNPEHYPRQAFVEDIYANLPMERIDALSLHIYSYAPYPAQWVVIIPYQYKDEKFEFYTPISSSSSTPAELNPLLFKAFWQGMDDFNSPTNTRQYYVASKQLI